MKRIRSNIIFLFQCLVLMPSEEEMKERQARQARAEGMPIIPTEAMLEMKGQSVSML